MKNKLIIAIASVSVIIFGSLFYLYFTFLNGTDFSKNIPKKAFFVMKANAINLGRKVGMQENNQTISMRNELMKNLSPSQKKMIEEISGNPTKSGIKFASNPTLCAFNASQSKEAVVLAFMFGISDAQDFKSVLSEMAKNLVIKEPNQAGFYQANLSENDQFVIYFNDSMGLILSDIDHKNIDFNPILDEIAGMKKDDSILSNEDYVNLNNQSNDMMAFFNMNELINAVSLSDYNEKSMNQLRKFAKSLPFGITLNFEEDAIALNILGSKTQEIGIGSAYKEGEFSESDLKNIDPQGTPLAYLTMNIDFKKIMNIIIEQNKYRDYSDIDNQVNQIASSFQLSKEELLNIIGGKVSFAFGGLQARDNTNIESSKPIINAWIELGNKNAAQKILDFAKNKGTLVLNQGIYSENNPYREPTFFMTVVDNNLFFSTQKEPLLKKIGNMDWPEIDEAHGSKDVTSNSLSIYANLEYSNYKNILQSQMGSYQFATINKFENILSSFKSVSINGKENDVEIIIKFSQKNTNSLQRIVELLQEAYQIAS